MVHRPIFVVGDGDGPLVMEVGVSFVWCSGFSLSQKRKSIRALHASATPKTGTNKILEVSTKSESELGRALSAFNLTFITSKQRRCTVECAYQGSKIFRFGGPYTDLYGTDSKAAKKDHRLKISGPLESFRFFGSHWPLTPRTAFYDWLYIKALLKNEELISEVLNFNAFSDIEFNPAKSVNCQARSVAMFVALHRRKLISVATSSRDEFLQTMSQFEPQETRLAKQLFD